MSIETKIPVLIAHGNPLVAAGLGAAFGAREDIRLITRCASDDLLGAALRLGSGGVAVTDYEAGILLRSAVQGDDSFHVLIVTASDSVMSIRKALELGTRGYLPLWSPVEASRPRRTQYSRWPHGDRSGRNDQDCRQPCVPTFDPPGNGGAVHDGGRPAQQGDRELAEPKRGHRESARQGNHDQARCGNSRGGRCSGTSSGSRARR